MGKGRICQYFAEIADSPSPYSSPFKGEANDSPSPGGRELEGGGGTLQAKGFEFRYWNLFRI